MKGWKNDPIRHGLAAKGVETKGLTIEDITDGDFGLKNLYHLTSAGLSVEDGFQLSEDMKDIIEELNERAEGKYEWIADLDYQGDIYVHDAVVSDETDESNLNWQENISKEEEKRGENPDPDDCVGYIHYHPPSVDKRPTAQDFILAFNIDESRNMSNKDSFRPTAFGLVRDDYLKFYFLTPSQEERKKYTEDMKEIRDSFSEEGWSTSQYFKKVEKEMEKMKDEGILYSTEEIDM